MPAVARDVHRRSAPRPRAPGDVGRARDPPGVLHRPASWLRGGGAVDLGAARRRRTRSRGRHPAGLDARTRPPPCMPRARRPSTPAAARSPSVDTFRRDPLPAGADALSTVEREPGARRPRHRHRRDKRALAMAPTRTRHTPDRARSTGRVPSRMRTSSGSSQEGKNHPSCTDLVDLRSPLAGRGAPVDAAPRRSSPRLGSHHLRR